MNLGKIIREYRQKANLTLKELAQKVGVSEQAISQYERNKRTPNVTMIKKIGNALSVDLLFELRKELNVNEFFVETAEYMVKYINLLSMGDLDVKGFSIDEVDEFYQDAIMSMIKILKKRKSFQSYKSIFCPPDNDKELFIEIK
ncbi:MAG: helix-turn-helix transcriptional regulator [Clostridium sp.]|nr:helix-turn-helix transcriptional regulator [Clostridium sp.]